MMLNMKVIRMPQIAVSFKFKVLPLSFEVSIPIRDFAVNLIRNSSKHVDLFCSDTIGYTEVEHDHGCLSNEHDQEQPRTVFLILEIK